jgi:DNA-directed RNA polymerase I subunit RPA49
MTENAVNHGDLNAESKVFLEAVTKNIADMPTLEDMAAAAQAEKPRPKANMSATKPSEVYPLESLISKDFLNMSRISKWQEEIIADGVDLTSRYVARRIGAVAQQNDVNKLQILKFMLGCILFHKALTYGGRGSKRVPSRDVLHKSFENEISGDILDHVRRRFCKAS